MFFEKEFLEARARYGTAGLAMSGPFYFGLEAHRSLTKFIALSLRFAEPA
jgi:hypothetical protein